MVCYDDFHTYNTLSHQWTRLNSTGDLPSARGGHSLTPIGSKAYLFGGSDRGISFNDLHVYDAVSDAWTLLFPTGVKPPGRSNHAAGLDSNGNLIVIGGDSNKGYLNDVWTYSPAYNIWISQTTSGHAPTPRELSSLVFIDSQGYLYGGFHEGGVSSELYMLDI